MSSLTPKAKFTVIPAVYLILQKNGKYLFGKRKNTGYMDGFYQLPSGHVDGNKSLKQGLCREAKEEINLEITPQDLKFLAVAHRLTPESIERVDFYFECPDFDESQIANNEPEKCSELTWLETTNPQIVDYTPLVFEKVAQGEGYLDFGFEN